MDENRIFGDAPKRKIPEPRDGRNLFVGVLVGVVTAIAFGLGGFFLIKDESGSMGWVLFLFLPAVTGFATALVAKSRNIVLASVIVALVFCTAFLLIVGLEGFVCVIMSSPLIAAGLAIGGLLGWLFRTLVIDKSSGSGYLTVLMLLVLPLFLMGANSAERQSRRTLRAQTVTDVQTLNASPESVWNELTSMDHIEANRPFLMKIGLPVPVSCKTEGEGVGGKRTCYFESGYIEEKITEWNPPASMKFEITASDVPGRPWLTFKNAGYEIKQEQGRTTVTRSTTIVSRLSPAWYWQRLEALGVHTEHRYLFEALAKRFPTAK
jgi:hypothetical protein